MFWISLALAGPIDEARSSLLALPLPPELLVSCGPVGRVGGLLPLPIDTTQLVALGVDPGGTLTLAIEGGLLRMVLPFSGTTAQADAMLSWTSELGVLPGPVRRQGAAWFLGNQMTAMLTEGRLIIDSTRASTGEHPDAGLLEGLSDGAGCVSWMATEQGPMVLWVPEAGDGQVRWRGPRVRVPATRELALVTTSRPPTLVLNLGVDARYAWPALRIDAQEPFATLLAAGLPLDRGARLAVLGLLKPELVLVQPVGSGWGRASARRIRHRLEALPSVRFTAEDRFYVTADRTWAGRIERGRILLATTDLLLDDIQSGRGGAWPDPDARFADQPLSLRLTMPGRAGGVVVEAGLEIEGDLYTLVFDSEGPLPLDLLMDWLK